MNKETKNSFSLVCLAGLIGLVGSYSANYFFYLFSNTQYKITFDAFNVVGMLSVVLFFLVIFLIVKHIER